MWKKEKNIFRKQNRKGKEDPNERILVYNGDGKNQLWKAILVSEDHSINSIVAQGRKRRGKEVPTYWFATY